MNAPCGVRHKVPALRVRPRQVLLDSVLQGRTVTITRHNVPKAVVLPAETYQALVRASSAGTVVAGLARQFDEMLERMQRPAARAGVRAAFKAAPGELGRAASRAARRGR